MDFSETCLLTKLGIDQITIVYIGIHFSNLNSSE